MSNNALQHDDNESRYMEAITVPKEDVTEFLNTLQSYSDRCTAAMREGEKEKGEIQEGKQDEKLLLRKAKKVAEQGTRKVETKLKQAEKR